MSANHTANFGLSQWEATDRVLRTDFNADNEKIDAALKAHGDAIALRGDCQLWTSSYMGDGTTNARSLTFPKRPKIVFIVCDNGFMAITPSMSSAASVTTATVLGIDVTWRGNTVSWKGGTHGVFMMNAENTTYSVIALLQA